MAASLDLSLSFILMKRILIILCALVALLSACKSKTQQAASQFQFNDDYGRIVNIPTQPKRIVSVSPAITEIIYALGAGDLLVGRTEFCTYPPETEQVECIGGITNLNIEKIVALNPDLVICGSMVDKKIVDQVEKMGIPMPCVIEKEKFNDLYDNIKRIGQLIGRSDKADSLIGAIRIQASQIDTLSHYDYGITEDEIPRPTVYYVVGFGKGGNYTAGGNTFVNDIIRMAGGRNIAENISGWNFSMEALMQANPDYIVVRKEDKESFCSMHPYDKLMAVRLGKVIPIESGTIDLQVPRNIEAIRTISDSIHHHRITY